MLELDYNCKFRDAYAMLQGYIWTECYNDLAKIGDKLLLLKEMYYNIALLINSHS